MKCLFIVSSVLTAFGRIKKNQWDLRSLSVKVPLTDTAVRFILPTPFDQTGTITSLSRSLFYRGTVRECIRNSNLAFIYRIRSSSQSDCSKSKTSVMSSLKRDQLGQRGSGDAQCAGLLRGLDHIRDPQLNKVSIVHRRNKIYNCYSSHVRNETIIMRDMYDGCMRRSTCSIN